MHSVKHVLLFSLAFVLAASEQNGQDDTLKISKARKLNARALGPEGSRNSWNLRSLRPEQPSVTISGPLAGKGTWAYVIDSGVNVDHSEFKGRASHGKCFLECGLSGLFGRWRDDRGHGTHVAGIIAGEVGGVAPEANIIDVKIANKCGQTSTSLIMKALDWISKDIAKNPGRVTKFLDCKDHNIHPGLVRLVKIVATEGIPIVVSAGNQGLRTEWDSPKGLPSVITVGAINSSFYEEPWSNFGPFVDILAPGVEIHAADTKNINNGVRKSGTSYAAPHATGIALSLLARSRITSVKELKERMIKMATGRTVYPCKESSYGSDRLNRINPTLARRLFDDLST
ncbi:hypothetical protein CP532_0350 [Ophiocordyceps camponoti-leonardi (nom. inval.)]|nr:hypothetical protein CP532_0350 [Ophiocordyceps camponoti-leonardi (nom. inval.)]